MEVLTVRCPECETPMPVTDMDLIIERRRAKINLWCYACRIEYIMIIKEGKPVMMANKKQLN